MKWKKLKKLSELVEVTLKEFPDTKDSDLLLFRHFYKTHFNVGASDYFFVILTRIHLGELPAFESVSRCRRKILELKKLKASPRVAKARKELEKSIKSQIIEWGK